MAYGINLAGVTRDQRDAMLEAKKGDEADDVVMVDLEEDSDEDIGADQYGDEQALEREPEPVDYELLISVAHGLGRWMQDTSTGKKVYVKDQDCIGCLRDLQRFLRRDDPDIRPVFIRLGEWRIAANDLVPLLVTYPHDKEVTLQAVKVLTYLTMPVDPATAKPEVQEGYVRDVKEAMLQPDALIAVLGLVAEPLAAHPRMSPEQQGAVQLVLVLLRNLLAVPDERPSPTLAAGSSRTRLQASLLSMLFSESIMELLLLVAQHGTQAPLKREMPTLLEILYDTHRGVTPQHLMAAKPPPPPRTSSSNTEQQQQRMQQQRQRATASPSSSAAQHPAPPPPPTSQSALGGSGQGRPLPAPSAAFQAGRGANTAVGRAVPFSIAPVAGPIPAGGAAKGPPRPPSLDSAVAAQLRRQQLANAAKLRGMAGAVNAAAVVGAARPGGAGGRFVIAHADDPGQRRTFLARPSGGSTAATTVKQHIVEAPLKMAGPRPLCGPSSLRSSNLSAASQRDAALVWKLRCFADDLLQSGYNQMMEVIRRDVSAGVGVGRLERPDLLRFMRLAAFFTEYCRLQQEARAAAPKQDPTTAAATTTTTTTTKAPGAALTAATTTAAAANVTGANVDPFSTVPSSLPSSPFSGISGTMGWDTFHLVCKLWVEQADMSNKLKDWELQAASMRLLCEMLAVLVVAHRHGTREDRQAADRLQRKLLHDDMQESGLLPVLSRLMVSFVPSRQSRSYACDLIMSLHYVLRMYDRLTALEPGGFMVRAKKRPGGRGGRRRQEQQQDGKEEEDVKHVEGEEGGSEKEGKDKEEEEEDIKEGWKSRGSGKAPLDELAGGSDEEEDEDEDEEGGGGGRRGVVERPMDLAAKVRGKLAQPAVIYFAVQLLACYRSLSPEVPRAIASLLYRIAAKEHLDMEPLLYQISVLRVFYLLLSDPELRSPAKLPAYREVLLLATQVVRNLFRKLVPERYSKRGEEEEEQRKEEEEDKVKRSQRRRELVDEIHDKAPRMLLVDMLFWKDHTAASAINQDYWLWMAMEDREREEAGDHGNQRRTGGGSEAGGVLENPPVGRRSRRGHDAWGDDDDRDEDGSAGAGGGASAGARGGSEDGGCSGSGSEGPTVFRGGRLRRPGGLWDGAVERGPGGDESNELADDDDDDGDGGGTGGSLRLRRAASGEEEEDGGGGGGGAARARPTPGGVGAAAGGDAAGAAEGAAARKPLTLEEREAMLRKRYLKTVRVGNGRNKRSGHVGPGGGDDTGGGGRGLRLSPAQQALLLQLFERHNCSRHNADVILECLKRGGAGAGLDGRPAAGEAADAAGVEMSQGQLMRQLKKMGLRFGQLTENQINRLVALHSRYRDDPDCYLMIAAQLPGGWTSKDVKRLLVKHGLTKLHRRGRRGADSGSNADADSGSEDEGEGEGGDQDDEDGDKASKRSRRGSRRRGAGEGGPVDVGALRRLYEEHKARPDHLNIIAALLPGGKTVKQVQRLLRSHGLLDDDAARRKRARDAVERTRLVALYQQTRGEAEQLEAIARLMPELAGGPNQVAKLLRKHGLTEGPGRQRNRRRSSDGGDDGEETGGGEEGGAARKGRGGGAAGEREGEERDAAPKASHARVRDPDPERILQALAGIQDAHTADGRWMDPRAAAAWVTKQLSAAESLWEMAGGSSSDYCLVMTGEEDEDFFMTEYSQDLLEACGIRNTADDYYKIPAASNPVWRQRVRQAMTGALSELGTERAATLAAELRKRREEEEEAQRREREARDAEEEAAARAALLFSKAGGRTKSLEEGGVEDRPGRGPGRGRGGGRRSAAGAGGGGKADAVGRREGTQQQRRRGHGRRSGGKAAAGVPEIASSGSSSSGSGASGSDMASDGGKSGSASDSDPDLEGRRGEALVMPNYGRSGSGSSASSSSSDGDVDDDDEDKLKQSGSDGGGDRGDDDGSGRVRKVAVVKSRARVKDSRGRQWAASDSPKRRRGVPEVLGGSSDGEREDRGLTARSKRAVVVGAAATVRSAKAGESMEVHRGGATAAASKDGPADSDSDSEGRRAAGVEADARRRALAEIARRRQEQARRLQQRVQGTLIPTLAPSLEERLDGGSDDGEVEALEHAGYVSGEGASTGSRRRRSGSPVRAGQLAHAAAVQVASDGGGGGAGGDDGDVEGDWDGADARGVGGGKRRRLLRKTATAGLGSGKENLGTLGMGLAGTAGVANVKGTAGVPGAGGPEEEMIELEDGLEDF